MQSYIGGGHIAFGADPAIVPIRDHMASLLFYFSFIGMVVVVIATRHTYKQSILLLDHVVKLIIVL